MNNIKITKSIERSILDANTSPIRINKDDAQKILDDIDQIFMPNGVIETVDYSSIKNISHNHLKWWMSQRGVFCIITHELCDMIYNIIDGDTDKTLEICAGYGTLGRELGVKMIDSHVHANKESDVYKSAKENGQALIQYPDDVEKLSCRAAMKKYKPRYVIGCWATQSFADFDKIKRKSKVHQSNLIGNEHGVNKERVAMNCRKLILASNMNIHNDRILYDNKFEVETIPLFGITRSRNYDNTKDYLMVASYKRRGSKRSHKKRKY